MFHDICIVADKKEWKENKVLLVCNEDTAMAHDIRRADQLEKHHSSEDDPQCSVLSLTYDHLSPLIAAAMKND